LSRHAAPARVHAKDEQDANGVRFTVELDSLEATEAVGRALAPRLGRGDVVTLAGPLGAGKTALARALIGARLAALGRPEEVPSPSFTLVQTYDLGALDLWHVDLYRLGDPSELAELGLEDAFAAAIVLVEWPERLGPLRPERALDAAMSLHPQRDEGRTLRLTARGPGWDWLAEALPAPAAASAS
jgi:tRNA threonylcarbamoyl adenosine modification protein YjeE